MLLAFEREGSEFGNFKKGRSNIVSGMGNPFITGVCRLSMNINSNSSIDCCCNSTSSSVCCCSGSDGSESEC